MAHYEGRERRRQVRRKTDRSTEMSPPTDIKNRSRILQTSPIPPQSPSNNSLLSAVSYERSLKKTSSVPRIRVPTSSSFSSIDQASCSSSGEDIGMNRHVRHPPQSPSNNSLLSAASYERSRKKASSLPRIRVPTSSSSSSIDQASYSSSGEDIGMNRHVHQLPKFDTPQLEEKEITTFDPNLEYDCNKLAIAQKLVLRMFMDINSSDVKFVVGEDDEAPPKIFHSHRFILEECAPALADLCKINENCDDGHTIVPIEGINPEVFHRLLYHVYGGKITDLTECAQDMIDAADKYDLPQLKLEAEDAYVYSTEITVDNLLFHILYADTRKCTTLKDAVIDFILDNEEEVSNKISVSVDESSRTLVWYW